MSEPHPSLQKEAERRASLWFSGAEKAPPQAVATAQEFCRKHAGCSEVVIAGYVHYLLELDPNRKVLCPHCDQVIIDVSAGVCSTCKPQRIFDHDSADIPLRTLLKRTEKRLVDLHYGTIDMPGVQAKPARFITAEEMEQAIIALKDLGRAIEMIAFEKSPANAPEA